MIVANHYYSKKGALYAKTQENIIKKQLLNLFYI
jgi:hypothetical protein